MSSLSYEKAGVNYDRLDGFKRACQKAAATTVGALAGMGLAEPAGVRGESAYLIEAENEYLAHVEEGLGTKNLVADAVEALTGECHYRAIGIDTVATIVNDLVTTGAAPISVAMHAGVGDGRWFANHRRAGELAEGFAEGCRLAGAVWGGGETPALGGIINPDTIVLAGSAIGRIAPKSRRIKGDVRTGDAIILLASSGAQTNGLSLCRALADKTPRKYLMKLPDGMTFGQALLAPSVIYARLVADVLKAGVDIHYAVHLTGHGWRKLMRLEEPFVYRMTNPGAVPPLFAFIQKHGPVSLREAYATFNMGAGFALFVAPEAADACLKAAVAGGYKAWRGGEVIKQAQRKAVEIVPPQITFEAESLQVR